MSQSLFLLSFQIYDLHDSHLIFFFLSFTSNVFVLALGLGRHPQRSHLGYAMQFKILIFFESYACIISVLSYLNNKKKIII